MAARVVHIGRDYCHRVPVLESAGYEVEGCNSAKELRNALKQFELKAVLVSESEGAVHQDMIREVRECFDTPVVLFRETLRYFAVPNDDWLFDLEVPVLQPPDIWLPDLAALIVRCQALQARSRVICSQAQRLCEESADARERSQRERELSREAARKIPDPEGLTRRPEDGDQN
jgi:hypothetical protein